MKYVIDKNERRADANWSRRNGLSYDLYANSADQHRDNLSMSHANGTSLRIVLVIYASREHPCSRRECRHVTAPMQLIIKPSPHRRSGVLFHVC